MSVSAGAGGTTLVGVVMGGGAVTQSASPATIVRSLPFTGASQVLELIAVALVLIVAGILAVGLARRDRGGGLP